MPAITFESFDAGLDLRKSADTADANRLRVMRNCYLTTGKQIRKRPGLRRIAQLEAGTKGLIAAEGYLNTFYAQGSITHSNSLFRARKVPHPSSAENVARVHFGDMFYGYLYAAIEYENGDTYHHYLDDPGAWAAATTYAANAFRRPTVENGFRYEVTAGGGGASGGTEPTWPTAVGATVVDNALTWTCRAYTITDTKCPHTKGVAKQQGKIYAIRGEVVRFCKTADARDWTTASDAGFLPVGSQQTGAQTALVLAPFQEKLAVFFVDGVQIWNADPDPALTALAQRIYNVGSRYRRSPIQMSGDTFFLSDIGFRSVTMSGISENLQDSDVGSPIDSGVVPTLTTDLDPLSVFYPGGGQFWCIIDRTAWVYSFSRTSKLAAWSEYTFPFDVDDAASLNGELYLRSGDLVYRVDDDYYTDDGEMIKVKAGFPFLNFKQPGVLKMLTGIDALLEGSWTVAHKFDPRNSALETDETPISGNTTPSDMTAVELVAVQVAPVFRHEADEAASLNAFTYYFQGLGAV